MNNSNIINLPVSTQLLIFGAFFAFILFVVMKCDAPAPIRKLWHHFENLSHQNKCIGRVRFFVYQILTHLVLIAIPITLWFGYSISLQLAETSVAIGMAAFLILLLFCLLGVSIIPLGIIFSFSLFIQRMHDIGISGKWYFVVFLFAIIDGFTQKYGFLRTPEQ